MKKKVCIITSSFPSHKNESTTAGVFVRDFALLLAEENFKVFVLAPQKQNSHYKEETISINFFPWLGGEKTLSSFNPKNPIHFFKLLSILISGFWTTLNFIKKNEIDVCLSMWAVPSGLFAWIAKFFRKTPYVVWALGSDIWEIQKYPFGKFILKKVLKNSNKLYADGLKLAEDVQSVSNKECEFLASSRILNTSVYDINYSKFDSSKINFMTLARFHTNKGVDLLIEAISHLTNEEKEKSLFHVFGGGPLESKIKKRVKELKLESNTFVNGYLDGNIVFSHMSKSDFIVIPSRIESIPVVLSDAIQSKKPVVITNVGDMGKLGIKYKIGHVVEPNVKSLADGLSKAIKTNQHQKEVFLLGMKELENYLDLNKSVKTFVKCIS